MILTMRPNFLAIIGSIHPLNQFDRRHHVLRDAFEHGVAVELAEIAQGRPAIVVDQNVGFRTRREQGILAVTRADIHGHRCDGDVGRLGDLVGGCAQRILVSAVL